MRATIDLSPRAESDLLEIGQLIAADSPLAAARFVREIERRIAILSVFPESGRRRDDLGRNVRAIAFDRRTLIVYQLRAEVVAVLAITYAGREIAADDLEGTELG